MKKTFTNEINKSGFAIIVTLLFLALLTTLVISFYFKTVSQLKITQDQTRLQIAELSSKTVKTILISDILNELTRNATKKEDHGYLYFRPQEISKSYLSRDFIPSGNPLFFVRRSDDGFEGGRIREFQLGKSSSHSTRKSDVVSDVYWKKFMGENSEIRDQPPQWRYLQRSESQNQTSIKGNRKESVRFAFRLYQLDGMMDIGGIPVQSEATSKTSDTLFTKIDFKKLGLTSPYQWFQWRYPSGKNDQGIVKGSALDSYSVGIQNRAILGRRDFIDFIDRNPNIFSKKIFHLWTHCNIQKNIPTYSPSSIPGASIDYERESQKNDAVNPDFLNIRVQREFLRRNGQWAKPGEPLVSQRFPLQHTLWLDSASEAIASSEQIEQYFGLKRDETDEDAWSYRSGQRKILTLKEVAELNREPDFFELLKSGILKGSLGLTMTPSIPDTNPYIGGGSPSCLLTGTVLAPYLTSDAQIIQIGVNIIDQYDTNSYVTRIKFSKDTAGSEMSFFGRENLPYCTRFGFVITRFRSPSNANVDIWLKPELWYPHDQKKIGGQTSANPTEFKLEITGTANFYLGNMAVGAFTLNPISVPMTCGAIQISNPLLFQGNQPLVFSVNSVSSSDGNNTINIPNDQGGVGFYFGNINGGPGIADLNIAYPTTSTDLKISLYYKRNGKYILYETVFNPMPKAGISFIPSMGQNYLGSYEIGPFNVARIDSRTARFGFHMYSSSTISSFTAPGYAPFSTTLLPNLTGSIIDPMSRCYYGPTNPVGISPEESGGYRFRVSDYIQNKPSGNYYLDPDNVARRSDAYYMIKEEENPLSDSTTYGRPLVLNRPFNSEADMGYAHRDLPYRSIDFFSTQSADSGLLDLFSIKDTPYRRDQINYNFSDPVLITSLLNETALHPAYPSRGEVSQMIGSKVSQSIQEESLNSGKWSKPITNRAKLSTLFSEKWGDLINTGIKAEREAIFRRLTPFFSANTWNLGLDLVVQTGYEIEKNGENVFFKESEFKSWESIVIDPFTAEILHRETEIIY